MSSGSAGRISLRSGLILVLVVSFALTVITNIVFHEELPSISSRSINRPVIHTPKARNVEGGNDEKPHELAGLRCEKYGGPSDKIAEEMVYWSDIPDDAKVISPFRDENKFLTFEPDHGGWNNIRMAMETVLVLAHAMGRTLVLPPEAKMYLLSKGDNKQKKEFTFTDFFHLDSIHDEQDGLDIITMEEFLEKQALSNNLIDYITKKAIQPPGGRTNWNGEDLKQLWAYLRRVGHVSTDWDPTQCTAAIPASKGPNDVSELERIMKQINAENINLESFVGKPVQVDASAIERLKENACERKKICIYDEEMQSARLIHFQTGLHVESKQKLRLLTHFYSFVFFQDWKQDLWSKRFVRDHMRYADEIMCAAAKVVDAMQSKAKINENSGEEKSKNGEYDALHVRRGDFQYKKTRIDANDLLQRSQKQLKKGTTLFIATDERDKSFFDPLKKYYTVYFLDDFMDLLEGVNTNYFGMIDQLVAYRSDKFIGTWWSTFSGYVNRMKGYYNTKKKIPGYKDGTMKSWYFIPDNRVDEMQTYQPVRKPLYMREFPTSWRGIDYNIESSK